MRKCAYRECNVVFGPETHANKMFCDWRCKNKEKYRQNKTGQKVNFKKKKPKENTWEEVKFVSKACDGCRWMKLNSESFRGVECTGNLFNECKPDIPGWKKKYTPI